MGSMVQQRRVILIITLNVQTKVSAIAKVGNVTVFLDTKERHAQDNLALMNVLGMEHAS